MPDGVNPKDILGAKKISFTKFPTAGLIQGTRAMMDGAVKYGPYNWRDEPVQAHIYVDAAIRHLFAWFSGEENSGDAGVHHLGHAMACCAILIDAQENNCLADDRPGKDTVPEMLKRYTVTTEPEEKVVTEVTTVGMLRKTLQERIVEAGIGSIPDEPEDHLKDMSAEFVDTGLR